MTVKRSGPSSRGPSRGSSSRGGPSSRGPASRGPSSRGPASRGPSSRDTDSRGPSSRTSSSRDSGYERKPRPAPRSRDEGTFEERPRRNFKRDGVGVSRFRDDEAPRARKPREQGESAPRRAPERKFADKDFGERKSYERKTYERKPRAEFSDRDAPRRDSRRDDSRRDDFRRDDSRRSDTRRNDSYRDAPRRDTRRDDAPRGDGPRYESRSPRRSEGRPAPRFEARDGYEKRPENKRPEGRVHHVSSEQMDAAIATSAAAAAMKGHEMLVYGVHAVQAALRNPKRVVTTIWVTDTGAAHLEGAFDAKRHPEPVTVTRREIDHKLSEGAVHQGIAIAVEPLEDVYLSDILAAASVDGAPRHLVVVLDEVTDPHNIGAIMRSMSMFGASAMIVHKRNAPPITGVMAKTATGAVEHIPMVPVTNLAKALEELQMAGFYCLGLDEDATITIDEAPRTGHVALVLGAEGEGLRAKTRSFCNAIAAIPSLGEIKSLNVSNAAAITLYSITRK